VERRLAACGAGLILASWLAVITASAVTPPLSASPCRWFEALSAWEHTLTEQGIDSVGRGLSRHNEGAFFETDSLYNSGRFGRPGSSEAREGARTHFGLRARSGIDYIVDMGLSQSTQVTEESALMEPFGLRYANTTLYPLRFLSRARAGHGGFCMEYQPPPDFEEVMPLGGFPVKVYTTSISWKGAAPVAGLGVRFESAMHKNLDLLYATNYCGRVSSEIIVDRGDTLELRTLHDMDGIYVAKAGVHRMTAIICWRSLVRPFRDPERARLGACAYFPEISIRLPSFLPDLGLDDLRDFDVPQPVLEMDWFARRQTHLPDWIDVHLDGGFKPWRARGPRPKILEERFPDL